MLQTSFPTPAAPRTATAAAAMLLGAGLACAGVAHAGSLPQPDGLDPSALPSQAASARDRDPTPVAAARGSMAGWKPVAHDKLDEMRGGFEMPGLQVSFGIERAVYINGALVVATSINIPDVGRITADQAARLATTLGPAIVAATNTAVNNALAGLTGGRLIRERSRPTAERSFVFLPTHGALSNRNKKPREWAPSNYVVGDSGVKSARGTG